MNLQKIDKQLAQFRSRIIKTLKLQQISSSSMFSVSAIHHQHSSISSSSPSSILRQSLPLNSSTNLNNNSNINEASINKQQVLCHWINSQLIRLKKEKQKQQANSKGIFNNKLFLGVVGKIVKNQEIKDNLQIDLKNLSDCVRRKQIPRNFTFESKNVPVEIVSLVNQLKQKKWVNYYGQVKGPLLSNMFIMKKQDFHSNVEAVKVNGLKFMMIEEKVAHRYQRNLIQQIFGRVFRSKGSLSMVIKIEVNHDPLEPAYNIFCYIQDRQMIDQDDKKKFLSDIKINQNRLQVQQNGKLLQVNQLNMLQIFLSQILVLPVQSLISDYMIRPSISTFPSKSVNSNTNTNTNTNSQFQPLQISAQQIQIIKCNQQDQSQIVKQLGLRQHPSLRNPLLFFTNYIRQHSILISQAKKIAQKRQLYACFYRCLEIVIKLMLTDFQTNTQEFKVNSSICFNIDVFTALWNVFHKIALISPWMSQVILPIKKSICISEIINHFCPVFNQISMSNISDNINSYRQFYHNVDMQTYLISISTKKSLQKYKDIFLNQSQVTKTKKYINKSDIYSQIFQPVLRQVNLQYLQPIESCYILYFICKYKYQYHPLTQDLQRNLKEKLLWDKCIRILMTERENGNQGQKGNNSNNNSNNNNNNSKGELPYIDIGFDILAYACDINVHQIDSKCFERVKNLQETQEAMLGINWFTDFIRNKEELEADGILSSLLEKAFKHRKFLTCKKLLQKKVRIRNFHQIISFNEIVTEMDEISRQLLVKTIQQDSPQMHRLFKWQQLMLVTLKKQSKDTIALQTLDFDTIYIPEQQLKLHIKNGKVQNNLSRKDYKFNSNRELALIQYQSPNNKNRIKFYLQSSQYPLFPYFYRAFLQQTRTPQIIPYFTSFFYQNKLIHLIQYSEGAMNYQHGLSSFKQEQLVQLTDQNLIGEAILIAVIIGASGIQMKDMVISPTKATRDKIFVVDWRNCYCKNFMNKYLGKVMLNCKNSLFLLDKMNKAISKRIINKYSTLDIEQISENVLQTCKQLNKKINILKQKYFEQDIHTSSSQLLALMFEQGYTFAMIQRMYKIKRMLAKKEGQFQKGLSYYRLLEVISSETSNYYQEICSNQESVIQREKVLNNQDWKRAFLQNNLVQFFGAFSRLEDKDNIFPHHYDKFCFEGPTENLVYAATNTKKLLAYKSTEIPQNLLEFSNQIFEYYMKNCDVATIDMHKKDKFIQVIKSKSKQHLESDQKRVLPLSYICIKSAQFIKQKNLASQFSFERVEELVVQSSRVGEYQLNSFPKTIQNILYLHLRDISGLKYIGQGNLYSKPLEIKHLKTLSIIQCPDLISIDLKCDILQNIQLRSNKALQSFNIFSLNLKNISVHYNPVLNFQNLAIYIIKGINVLVCKSSCHGDFMKVYNQDYDTYVTYVMRYLMVKFFEDSGCRYNIMFTLLKIKEIDESLFAMGGLGNLKGMNTLFNKFTSETQDKILIQLLRLYVCNPYRKKISFSDLSQNPTIPTSIITPDRVIRLLGESLNKVFPNNRVISQIKFDYPFQFFNSVSHNNTKIIVNRMKFDKNFAVVFQNMRDDSLEQEVKKQKSDRISKVKEQKVIVNQGTEKKNVLARYIEAIKYIAVQKSDPQKVTLVFRQSTIKYSFLDQIFKGTVSLQQIVAQQQDKSPLPKRQGMSIYRQTLKKESNQSYIKIFSMHFDGCQMVNDRIVDLSTLDNQLKRVSEEVNVNKNSGQSAGKQKEIKTEEIKIQDILVNDKLKVNKDTKELSNWSSVKHLKIENCSLKEFQIVKNFSSLVSLSLCKSQVKIQENRKSVQVDERTKRIQIGRIRLALQNLFKYLQESDIQILDLENFFTQTCADSAQWDGTIDKFFKTLTKMKKLHKLKLNKNYFSLDSLKKLDKILNETTIQQLELNGISLPFDRKGIYKNLVDVEQHKAFETFSNLFINSQNLKSLAIQLNSKDILKHFICAISQNTSLIQLKLTSLCQVPSETLNSLNKNKTISLMSSNMQLPVWLLTHLIQNGKMARKSMMMRQSSQQQQQQSQSAVDNVGALGATSLSLGSMNSLRAGGQYFKLGLSLDGGGARGMLLATELHYLASRVGYPLHKIFDCIGGTSIGGILALASAGTLDGENPIANTQELMNLFSKYGKDIFKKTQIMQLRNLFDTKYSATSFQGVLKNYFKDSRLSNCLSETSVIVTAVNRVDNKDYIFRSMEALLNRDKDFYMRDVARATSAAPTYFPSAQIKNVNASVKLSLVDGGVGMNNPSKLVIDEVKKISVNSGSTDNYFLLSLGTGKLPNQVIPQYAGLKDLSPIIDSFTQSAAYFVQRDLASNYKGHFFRVSPLINVKVKKDAELDNTSESVIQMYRSTGLQAAKKYFQNTVIFGKYRNMNLIEWLKQNTARKYQF